MNLFLTSLSILIGVQDVNAEIKTTTTTMCTRFYGNRTPSPVVPSKLKVPLDRNKPFGDSVELTYWVRKGSDPTQTPIILIHGGPGGNSSRFIAEFKNSEYTGDIVFMDNRNEGESKIKSYTEKPNSYRFFRGREIVKDLEDLRKHLYGQNSKWRVFGQSRGAAIATYYFEMFPESFESFQTHGWAMMTRRNMESYTKLRSEFNARASDRFAELYPEAAQVIIAAKAHFTENNITMPINLNMANLPIDQQPTVTGALITDSISYKLSNYSRWKDISAALLALRIPDSQELDLVKTKDFFQKEINGNIYVQYFNYILGTNAMDIGSPTPMNFKSIRNDHHIMTSLISEGRFVADAVYPAYLSQGFPPVRGRVESINFRKIMRFLREYEKVNGRKFSMTLFSSYFDTVAGPEMYSDIQRILAGYVDVKLLSSSGHEGWQTESTIRNHLFREGHHAPIDHIGIPD